MIHCETANESGLDHSEVRQGELSLVVLLQHSLICVMMKRDTKVELLCSVKGICHFWGNCVIMYLPKVTQIHGYFLCASG